MKSAATKESKTTKPTMITTTTTTNTSTSIGSVSSLFGGLDGPLVLSNEDHNEERLSMLLGSGFSAAGGFSDIFSDIQSEADSSMDDIMVDVTLRTPLGQAPALMLLITDPGKSTGNVEKYVREPVQVSLSFEVGLNGRITVLDSSGLGKEANHDNPDSDMQGTDDNKPSLQDIHKKIARVIEISQDLGTLVEWVLRSLRERADSG